jgi:hypothetical protein
MTELYAAFKSSKSRVNQWGKTAQESLDSNLSQFVLKQGMYQQYESAEKG